MASINKSVGGAVCGGHKEGGFLFFGDFDKEECGKYFKKVNAVKFVRLEAKEKQKEGVNMLDATNSWTGSSVTSNEGNLAEEISSLTLNPESKSDDSFKVVAENHGFVVSEVDSSCKEEQSNKASDQPQLSQNEMCIGMDSSEGQKPPDEKQATTTGMDKISTAEVGPVKSKPSSWAALFKSNTNSNTPSAKAPTIISVQFEDTESKNQTPGAQADCSTEQSSKGISIEKDQDALALADFLEKTSINAGNTVLQLRGLINNGNWCYINATLQSLLGCHAFYRLFKSMASVKQKGDKVSSTPLTDTMMQFANEFSVLDMRAIHQKSKKTDDLRLGPSFEPKQVYDILSVLKSTLSETGKQQDAEEFLTFLLNGLHEEFAALSTLVQSAKKTNHFVNSNEKMMNGTDGDYSHQPLDQTNSKFRNEDESTTEEWERVGRNNKTANLRKASCSETLITKLFGGIIRSSVHHSGAKESATLQPFFTIQLDIQADNIWNIKDAFENYFTKESIEGFTSSKTKSKVEASHKTSLEKLPQVLILHLKYFVYDKTGGCQKTHKHIDISRELEIPKDVLSSDLKGRVPANQRSYELFAVEFHHGKHAAGGHYTTAVRHRDPLGWVYCNDSIIHRTQFNQITKQQRDKMTWEAKAKRKLEKVRFICKLDFPKSPYFLTE